MAEARGVSPGDLAQYVGRVRAVLGRDHQAVTKLRSLLRAASRRAVEQLAFETALQIQAEASALDWLVAPQRVTGRCNGLVISACADGVEFTLAASRDRLDQWTVTRTAHTETIVSAATPPQWHAFAIRTAELAAALARP